MAEFNVKDAEKAIAKLQKALPHGTINRIWEWQKGYYLVEAPEGEIDHSNPYYMFDLEHLALVSFSPQTEMIHWLEIMSKPIYVRS